MQFELNNSIYKEDLLKKSIDEYNEYSGKKVNLENKDDKLILDGNEGDLVEVVDTYIYIYNEEN